ncbi:hypothetical protein LCGC14_1875460 [marine sediment metagenome]|uniref:Uncharacterized protein n=1 Tax=marine sediment metagenome TaxID=412755 RepID=A0A0F9IHS5_9ZZZZ
MSKQIKLIIPQVPLSINKTRVMHWAKLRKVKKLWVDEVWVAFHLAKRSFDFPLSLPLKKADVSIKIFFRTNAHRDADNYPCKEVIDAIKNNGLIVDDDYEHIGKTDIDITGRDKEHPRTEITIEEITDAKNKIR